MKSTHDDLTADYQKSKFRKQRISMKTGKRRKLYAVEDYKKRNSVYTYTL